MRLHTPKNMKDARESKEQASAKAHPLRKMPKIEGTNLEAWLQASLAIHEYMDSRVAKAKALPSSYALDMSGKIAADLSDLGAAQAAGIADAGIADEYLSYLKDLPDHRFLNHYYNLKNAHFAGGRMFHR